MTTSVAGGPTTALTPVSATTTRRPGKRVISQLRASGKVAQRRTLPEYLTAGEIEGLLRLAVRPEARMLMLIQWRAGLRVSEALALEAGDIDLDGVPPVLRVRLGKGRRTRLVPVHPELSAALRNYIPFLPNRRARLVTATRSTAFRWVQAAVERAVELGVLAPGRKVGTHTLRHSAARHWLASGVPVNVVSRWLGHASIQTTLVYLELLPDPAGFMDRVP